MNPTVYVAVALDCGLLIACAVQLAKYLRTVRILRNKLKSLNPDSWEASGLTDKLKRCSWPLYFSAILISLFTRPIIEFAKQFGIVGLLLAASAIFGAGLLSIEAGRKVLE
jgi:hypothetical protein